MKKEPFYLFLFFIIVCKTQAQDIKGAYINIAWVPTTITFTPIYEYTYTLTLLTDPLVNIPRPTVTLYYGDNTSGTLSVISTTIVNGTTIKTYTSSHLYAGGSGAPPAHYKVQFLDSFRVTGINNIANSQMQSIKTETRIYASNLFWTKSSGTITNFPPVLSVSGSSILYDPMFIKGTNTDSVSYTLFNCFASSYYSPNDAIMNASTGVLTFSKDSLGLYAFYIRIQEWGKNTSNVPQINRTTFVDLVIDINATVGINEHNWNAASLKIYPNPTSKYLFYDNLEKENKNLNYSIYSVSGQKLSEGILNSTNQKSVDVSNLQQGLYFLIIDSGSQSYGNKFVKTND